MVCDLVDIHDLDVAMLAVECKACVVVGGSVDVCLCVKTTSDIGIVLIVFIIVVGLVVVIVTYVVFVLDVFTIAGLVVIATDGGFVLGILVIVLELVVGVVVGTNVVIAIVLFVVGFVVIIFFVVVITEIEIRHEYTFGD